MIVANEGVSAPGMLTLDDIAALLRCSPATVSRMAGAIPGRVKLARLVRFEPRAVHDWILSGCPLPERPKPKLKLRRKR